jgi:hypothetical protein
MPRRHAISGLAAVASLVVLLCWTPGVGAAADTLPDSISDRDFWNLSEQLSEPNGYFVSDNLVSNERTLSTVAQSLASRVKTGGVYLGVGPEQNFTYIAAIQPKMAFITDIRRGNLHMHLMYKALFELSADRADFVSRLLTKPRPPGLTTKSTAADLMNAYWDIKTSDEATYKKNLDAIYNVLTKTHGWTLSSDDRDGIAYVYHAFYWFGPSITYGSSTSMSVTPTGVTYADLMMALDAATGQERTYLATEERFNVIKDLHKHNLLVPVVGDFAGPKALRGVGQYIRDHGATVTAFYVSNVEQYLRRNNVWQAFCSNVATMPLDEASVFIRPGGMGGSVSITRLTPVAGASGYTVVVNGTPVQVNTSQAVPMLTGGPPTIGGMPFSPIVTEIGNCGR